MTGTLTRRVTYATLLLGLLAGAALYRLTYVPEADNESDYDHLSAEDYGADFGAGEARAVPCCAAPHRCRHAAPRRAAILRPGRASRLAVTAATGLWGRPGCGGGWGRQP